MITLAYCLSRTPPVTCTDHQVQHRGQNWVRIYHQRCLKYLSRPQNMKMQRWIIHYRWPGPRLEDAKIEYVGLRYVSSSLGQGDHGSGQRVSDHQSRDHTQHPPGGVLYQPIQSLNQVPVTSSSSENQSRPMSRPAVSLNPLAAALTSDMYSQARYSHTGLSSSHVVPYHLSLQWLLISRKIQAFC